LRVVDLTRSLGPSTRVYPGDPPVRVRIVATLEKEGYLNREVCMGEHSGTHVDAPAHMVPGGATVDSLPVDRLVAPALVLDVSNACGPVTWREIMLALRRRAAEPPGRGWYLILKTGGGCRSIAVDLAEAMVKLGMYGLGVDAPSPDEEPYPVHRILLSNGLAIVEGLDVPSWLDGRTVTLVVAPLKIEGGSGAPARVLAILDGGELGKKLLQAERG